MVGIQTKKRLTNVIILFLHTIPGLTIVIHFSFKERLLVLVRE